jgi:hypothetical protein
VSNPPANAHSKPPLSYRLKEELFKYALVSGYLFISFSMLLLFKATTADGQQDVLPFGIALVKSLVLAKFLLIGDALKAGGRAGARPLLPRVAWKSLAFLGVLLVFTAIEELVVGYFHHKRAADVVHEVLSRSWLENLAPVLVMLLILVPLVCISEIYKDLGAEQFRKLWLGRPSVPD